MARFAASEAAGADLARDRGVYSADQGGNVAQAPPPGERNRDAGDPEGDELPPLRRAPSTAPARGERGAYTAPGGGAKGGSSGDACAVVNESDVDPSPSPRGLSVACCGLLLCGVLRGDAELLLSSSLGAQKRGV